MLTEREARVTVVWMKLRSSVKQAFSHPVTQHLGLGPGAQLFPLVTLSSEGGDARTRQPQTLKTQAHQWRHGTVYTLKKNLLQNLTSLLFYTYKQSRKCVHTDSFSLQDLKAHRLVRRERSTSPPCLWQITPSQDLRGCKPSVRQNLSVTDISSFRSYSEPRDKCVQKCCTWDWLFTECTLECLQQQSGGLKETCGFLF